MSLSKYIWIVLGLILLSAGRSEAQCLSSVNPVGGSNNLLVLEKKSVRIISFYRYNYGDRYFEGSRQSDFNLIRNANYNYAGATVGYGLAERLTVETELGYFFNKTQNYNLEPSYSLVGRGFSNAIFSVKYGILKNNEKRFFISASLGPKIPFSTTPQVRNGVELPVEVQPTVGSFGGVVQFFMVKEVPLTGTRYFLTSRMEINSGNRQDYRLGTSVFTSLFWSKHLMLPWLRGDWTAIAQVRNEIRTRDRTANGWKESSGSTIFYASPQLVYTVRELWNISLLCDIPVFQYFRGTQLAANYGLSLTLSRDLKL